MTIHIPPIQTFEDFSAEAHAFLKPLPFKSKLGGGYVDEFVSQAVKRDWIVKRALLARTLSLIIGPGGCGKSFLTLDLAMTLALAAVDEKHPRTWFRRRIKPCGVIYIAGEGQEDFIFRMRAWMTAKGLPLTMRLPIILIPRQIDMRTSEDTTKLLIEEVKARSAEMLENFGIAVEVVIIDTMSKAMAGGDDVKPEHVGAFYRNCGQVRSECDVTTIVVHHTPQGSMKARGHGSVSYDNDGEWLVTGADGPTPNAWRVTRVKAAAVGDKHEFRLRVQKLGTFDEDGDEDDSLVVSEHGFERAETAGVQANLSDGPTSGPAMTSDGRFLLGDNLTLTMKALARVIESVGQDAPQNVRAPFGRKVVTMKDWKEEIARAIPSSDKGTDAFRKKVERALEAAGTRLSRKGFIEIDGDHVWRTKLRVASVDPSTKQVAASEEPAKPSPTETLSSADVSDLSKIGF